jgi:heat shock protein 1/8
MSLFIIHNINIMNYCVGIDLGTTYSAIGYFKENSHTVEIICNEFGNRTTPSWVSFTDTERLIGDDARSMNTSNVKNTIFDIKRLIGRKYSDPEVQKDIKQLPYDVIEVDNDEIGVRVEWKKETHTFTPIEISAMILQKMKLIAETYLNNKVTNAVITVPAYFNDSQRDATKLAGKIAGLNVLRIINEPTSASLAYGIDNESTVRKTIAVYDLGGGTLDVTVITLGSGTYQVKSTAGDSHLGGVDIDMILTNHTLQSLKKHAINVWKIKNETFEEKVTDKFKMKIRNECEKVKKTLSNSLSANLTLEFCDKDYKLEITRNTLNNLCKDFFQKCLLPLNNAMKDSGISKHDIHKVVMIGGSSRIPKIKDMLIEYFGKDVICNSINPDEAVAYGATLQASKLTNISNKELLLVDVTPLTLGVESKGGVMAPIIKRNTTIPVSESKIFSTAEDNQPSVSVQIYEGERLLTKENNLLGKFDLVGIAPAKKGVPRISVTLSLDANGILSVAAEETSSGKKNSIIIENKNKLSDEVISKMISDAEQFRQEDEKYKKRILIKNELETLLSNMKNTLEEHEKKLDNDNKLHGFELINNTQEWFETNYNDASLEDFEKKYKELMEYYTPLLKTLFSN